MTEPKKCEYADCQNHGGAVRLFRITDEQGRTFCSNLCYSEANARTAPIKSYE